MPRHYNETVGGRSQPKAALPSPAIRPRGSLIAAVLVCAFLFTHAATGSKALAPHPGVGVQFHCTWDQSEAKRRAITTKLGEAGVQSVRIDVGWSSLEPRRRKISRWHVRLADRCVNLARSHGIEVLATILWTPAWANSGRGTTAPPARTADFAWFARWAAHHFRGRVAAWEIWNEPNDRAFWNGSVRRYVHLLRAAYPAIKKGDPNALVVFGGVVHNDDRYLQAAYKAGAHGVFDVMGTHAYQGVADAAPETVDTGGDWWLMTHVPAVHELMARHGDGGKQIWFTEFGWSVHDNRPSQPLWQRGVSAAEQASYLTRAFTLVGVRYPYVTKAFWYKDAARPGEDDVQSGYGLLRTDLTPRPSYWALKSLTLG